VEVVDLRSGKSAAVLQSNRVKPKFGNLFLTFNVDMGRFIAVACEKEKPERCAQIVRKTASGKKKAVRSHG
jgi:hypothetical protein